MNITSLKNTAVEDRAASTETGRANAAAPTLIAADTVALQPRLALLLDDIGAGDVRELMRTVFTHASRILGLVVRVRKELEQEGAAEMVPTLLREVSSESRQLLAVVETAELRVENFGDALRETFDSVAFAMGHELRRVFADELARRDGPAGRGVRPVTIVRACGLIENCLQQSVVTLAQAFDPTVTGLTVFEDYRERRENSLVLRDELASLVTQVRAADTGAPSVLANISVLRHVRRFRYEYMHLLMYRDWEEFEKFADALEENYEAAETFPRLLHSFSCYLLTLHRQVSLRSVLAED